MHALHKTDAFVPWQDRTGGDYTYDWAGNRLSPPASPYQMQYNDADQLTRWPGMYEYSYDGAGNLHQVKKDGTMEVLRSYTYHPSGLLNQATYAGRVAANTWDGDSNRVALTINGGNYSFVYDATAGIPAVIAENTPDGVVYYFREPNGSLIARKKGTTWSLYHFDELGSTTCLTDRNGTITDRYTYDPWGNLLTHTGATNQPYQYVGQLGYYTHYMDPEFKLLQLGVRFYDTEIGRFTQRDPQAIEERSTYAYVNDQPIRAIDPTGEIIEVRQKGIHGFICINAQCWGFYPSSEIRAALNCCSPGIYLFHGRCCDVGQVRDNSRDRSGSKIVASRESSREEEARLKKWIEQWQNSRHIYCLLPNYPLSNNCWTWALEAYHHTK